MSTRIVAAFHKAVIDGIKNALNGSGPAIIIRDHKEAEELLAALQELAQDPEPTDPEYRHIDAAGIQWARMSNGSWVRGVPPGCGVSWRDLLEKHGTYEPAADGRVDTPGPRPPGRHRKNYPSATAPAMHPQGPWMATGGPIHMGGAS